MKNIKILIAEDEVIIGQYIKIELELMGYDVCSYVLSGENAILKAKEDKPDLILMDINLSGEMDGIDAAKEIISFRNIPVIFCTAYGEKELMERAEIINPLAYLRKPIDITEIKAVIDEYFGD